MKLLISEKLRHYRRQRNLTQEEVAAHLGISYQAVSKWERGEGYPDITLLPALANYFGITVDELIGMNEIGSRACYDEINRIWAANNRKGNEEHNAALHQQNADMMREALKTYPNDALLLVQLSTSLEKLNGTPEEKQALLCESIRLQEQILRGEDSEVRSATLFNICFAYQRAGEHAKALAAAQKLPNLYKTRESALVSLATGEDRHTAALTALAPLAYLIRLHLNALAETEQNERWNEKIQQILSILFDEITLEEAQAVWQMENEKQT